jgi:hypothetical protein
MIKLLLVGIVFGFTIVTQHETPLDFVINPSNGVAIEEITVPYLLATIAAILIWKK